MVGVSSVVERFVVDTLFNRTPPMMRRYDIGQGLFALSAIFILIGIGFLGYGTYLWLGARYASETAALAMGAIALLFSGGLVTLTLCGLAYRAQKVKAYRHNMVAEIETLFATLDEEFGDPIRTHPKKAVLAAAIAGFLLEERIF